MFIEEKIVVSVGKDKKKRKKKILVFRCDACKKIFEAPKGALGSKKRKNAGHHFCSRDCIYNFDIICIVCKNKFNPKAMNQKTCSKLCFNKHRCNRTRVSSRKRAQKYICRFCNLPFFRDRERNGFCSRSCASRFYIKNGTYDNWVNSNTTKSTSKDSLDLYSIIKEEFQQLCVEKEKRVYTNENKYYKVDILIKELRLVIEFNGCFWHADPFLYNKDFFNPVSKKTAKQIWDKDNKKILDLIKSNNKVEIIWENEYRRNKENMVNKLKRRIKNLMEIQNVK